jgi:hypothetical protein
MTAAVRQVKPAGGTTSATISGLTSTLAGSLLVVGVSSNNVTAPTFSKYTWTKAVSVSGAGNQYIYYTWNITGADTSIVVTVSSGANVSAMLWELTGMRTASDPLDTNASIFKSSALTTAWTLATGARATAGEVVIGFSGNNSTIVTTGPTSPWTTTAGTVSGSSETTGSSQIPASTTSLTYAGSTASNSSEGVVSASFLLPSAVVNVSVTGAAPSTVTSASPVGSVEGDTGVTGVVTDTVSASPVGSVNADAGVTGAAPSTVTSASPVGAVTVSSNLSVTGAAPSTVTSASPVGTVGVGVIGAVPSTVTSASPVGSVKVGVTGVAPGTVTSSSPVGTVTGTASITGAAPSTVTSASPVGTVKGTASITGAAPNTVTSASPVGSVSTNGNITITGAVPSTVTSASPVGTVRGTASLVGAAPSTVTSASPIGRVGVGVVGVAPATVTSASPVGSVRGSATLVGAVPFTVLSASPIGTVSAVTPARPLQLAGSFAVDQNFLGGPKPTDANTFGGTVRSDFADGTVTHVTKNGSVTHASPVYNGSVVNAHSLFGGSVVNPHLSLGFSSLEGCTMQAQNIVIGQFNDEVEDFSITQNGSAFNLTGYTLKAYLKTAAGVDDADPSTIVLSSTGGTPAIVVTNATLGTGVITIPHADLGASESITFWRLDVINTATALQNTAIYGQVAVTLL